MIEIRNGFNGPRGIYFPASEDGLEYDMIFVPSDITEAKKRWLRMNDERRLIPQDVLYPPEKEVPPKKKKIPDWLRFFDK